MQLWPWPAASKLIKIGGFHKCKIHSSSLKGFRVTACQIWCISAPARIWTHVPHEVLEICSRVKRFKVPSSSSKFQVSLQLWQAVILKPFKLKKCILHFWKSPIFIYLVTAGQGHTCALNTWKFFLEIKEDRALSKNALGWPAKRLHRQFYIRPENEAAKPLPKRNKYFIIWTKSISILVVKAI